MRAFKSFFKTSVGMKASGECAPCEGTKVADEAVINGGHYQSSGTISGLKGAFGTPKPKPPTPTPAPEPSMSLGSRITSGLNKRFGH